MASQSHDSYIYELPAACLYMMWSHSAQWCNLKLPNRLHTAHFYLNRAYGTLNFHPKRCIHWRPCRFEVDINCATIISKFFSKCLTISFDVVVHGSGFQLKETFHNVAQSKLKYCRLHKTRKPYVITIMLYQALSTWAHSLHSCLLSHHRSETCT